MRGLRPGLEFGPDPTREYFGIPREARSFRSSAIGFAVVISAVFTGLAVLVSHGLFLLFP